MVELDGQLLINALTVPVNYEWVLKLTHYSQKILLFLAQHFPQTGDNNGWRSATQFAA